MKDKNGPGPVRKIPMGRRSVTGRWPVRSRMVAFESTLERDFLILAEADRSVATVTEQPLAIPYVAPGGRRAVYVPDFQVERRDGGVVIAEIKYKEELDERGRQLRPRFRAAFEYAKANGWRFRLYHEGRIRTPLLRNLGFLRGYPDAHHAYQAGEEHIVARLEAMGTATPRTLLAAAYACDDNRTRAIAVLWGLVGSGRIVADLTVPLTMESPLRVASWGGTDWPGPHAYSHPLGHALWRRLGVAPPERRRIGTDHETGEEHAIPYEEGT